MCSNMQQHILFQSIYWAINKAKQLSHGGICFWNFSVKLKIFPYRVCHVLN